MVFCEGNIFRTFKPQRRFDTVRGTFFIFFFLNRRERFSWDFRYQNFPDNSRLQGSREKCNKYSRHGVGRFNFSFINVE